MRKRPFINIHLDRWQSLLDVILARPVVQYSNTLHNTLPATSCHTRWPLSNLFAQIFVFNTRYFHPHILKFSPLTTNAQCYNIFYWRMVPLQEFYKLIQGGFFDCSALKMTKCQTHWKIWHLELFWRDLHVIWHLVIFRADQLKKPPCTISMQKLMEPRLIRFIFDFPVLCRVWKQH